MASPLHLIDGAGVITTPLKVARYLAEVLGADPSTLPDAAAAAGSGVPSISVLHERGMNYRVVAVFGGQSTGKSTLLNELFGTSFATMNSEEGRSQTTKGCFLSKAILNHDTAVTATGDLFVMDFEGTDGVERGENQNFEKQLSLFALSVADTLIVNMFAHEVGRFNAANLSLLQAVFEVNLQLLSHEPRGAGEVEKPTLLFVLRDHTRGPVQKLQDGIVKSLEGIWSKISKPASFADSDIGDFFNMSFCALPHYDLQRPLFDEAANILRRRFSDIFCPAYLYKGVGQDNYRHVALDDVADYLASCWRSIQTVEDLDIPTQRDFVAITRCRNVSDALASDHEGEISERLRRLRDGVFTSNISGWTQDVIGQCKALFASHTAHYPSTVTQKVTAELQHRLEQAARPLREAQCRALCSAMSRASVDVALTKALDIELPRLAAEWFSRVKRDIKRYRKAGVRMSAADEVTKFWDFIEIKLNEIQRTIRQQIASIDAAAPTQRDPNVESILKYLRGDDEAMRRTTELVPSILRQEVLHRMRLVASDLSESMKKAFDRHISATNGSREAFGPARAIGLLLAACVTVCRLRDFADGSRVTADPAVATLLQSWAADAMQLQFAISKGPEFITAPVYPALPESDGAAASCGGDAFDVARRFFAESCVIVGSDCLQCAIGLYFKHCDDALTQLTSGAVLKALFLAKLAITVVVAAAVAAAP